MANTWNLLTPQQQALVLQALQANAQTAGVELSGPVTVSAEGAELVVPDGAL